MLSRWQKLRATVPGTFQAALLLMIGFFAFVAWDQSHWWRVKEDYAFGWLVPLFVVYVIRERWPSIVDALDACATRESPRAAGFHRWVLRALVAAALVLGILFFLLGSFYRAGAGTSQPGTLAITLGMVGIVFALLFVNAPDSPSPARATAWGDARLQLVLLFFFPIVVWLVSAPIVSAVETQLSLALQRRVVTVVAFVFDSLGLPIEQQGNVLALPSGEVGVAEACSGMRSLTGCLFAGSFLAALWCDGLWRKIALLGAALLLAFLTNLARSLFLTSWAYHYGPRAIEGRVHDVAGYAVLGLTVITLFGLLPMLPPASRPRAGRPMAPALERLSSVP